MGRERNGLGAEGGARRGVSRAAAAAGAAQPGAAATRRRHGACAGTAVGAPAPTRLPPLGLGAKLPSPAAAPPPPGTEQHQSRVARLLTNRPVQEQPPWEP